MTIPDGLIDAYRRLVVADLAGILPGDAVSAVADVSEDELRRLLSAASAMALSGDDDDRRVGYEIVTRALEVTEGRNPGVIEVCDVILARLGNFPGRDLLRERHQRSEKKRGARLLALEAISREAENGVDLAGKGTVTLTDFQHDLFAAAKEGGSISVSAPTSAGKSFVLSLLIARRVTDGEVGAVVYIVPTRALIRQVAQSVAEMLRDIGHEDIPVRTVPIPVDPAAHSLAVYVLTQERLTALLQNDVPMLGIAALIVDEATSIGDGARGVVLQSAIDAVLSRWPNVRLIFASPLASNPRYLLDLFGRAQRDEDAPVTTLSPVLQNVVLISKVFRKPGAIQCVLLAGADRLPLGERVFHLAKSKAKRLAQVAKAVTKEDDLTIVYCDGAAAAEKAAVELASAQPPSDDADDDVADLIEFLRVHVHKEYGLGRVLRSGVAYHYGQMPGIVRSRVEDLAARGKLQFVCCTSTLLAGVNLPARHIVIENPHRGSGNPMDRASFLNLAGRAGRLRREFHGNVWCILPETWTEKSFQGQVLQPIRAAFETALDDGGGVIQRALDGTLDRDERQLGEAALGKAFVDYTQKGLTLVDSRYKTAENQLQLATTDRRCAEIRVSLPPGVFARNATVPPGRLEDLHKELRTVSDLRSVLPLMPWEVGFNVRLREIFGRVERCLAGVQNDSYVYHSWLAAQWIHDVSLSAIIDMRLKYERNRQSKKTADDVIRAVMSDIETDLRFRYVKHTRAYGDVLVAMLVQRGEAQLAASMAPLHLYLECGASDAVTLSLLSIGLSRTTALLLRKRLPLPLNATPEYCASALRRTDLSRMDLPGVCRREITELVGAPSRVAGAG